MTQMFFRHSGNPIDPCELIYRGERHSVVQFTSGYRKEVNNLRLEIDRDRVRTMKKYREIEFDCDGSEPGYGKPCYAKPDYYIESRIDILNRWMGVDELATRRVCAAHLGAVCKSLGARSSHFTITPYEGR